MTGSTKRKTVLLLGLVILLTMLIATSLPQLEFQPGLPLPRLEEGQLVAVPVEAAPFVSISVPKFILVLIALLLTGTALVVAVQLLRGVDWKLILSVLRYVLIISMVIGCLVFLIILFPESDIDTSAVIPLPTPTPQPVATSPLGTAPPFLLWLVGMGLLGLTVLVAVGMFTPSRQARSLELLGLEAERSRQALVNGVDLKDVIVSCYRQMSLAMKQEKGIEREDFMTTGEFETVLESAGIPHEPVHQLTQLFEAVRYGHWQAGAGDEKQALQCLEAIMVHSRNASRKNRYE
jgi:hypothetical protein